MGTPLSDLMLLKKIKKQDMNALLDWFEARQAKFYKIGWAHLKNHHDVEDVFHNTVIIVHEKIEQLKEDQYFETWVTTIFINECRLIYRKRKRESEHNPPERVHNPASEAIASLDQLEEIHKEVVILTYIQGYSQKEIAQILNIPLGTVKSRIYRGLRTLRKIIEGGERNGL